MAGLDSMKPQMSRVTKSLDNFIVAYHGLGGLGKTPVACKFPKPIYFAFGKSGISGLNNVPFYSIKSWAEFKKYVKFFSNPANYEDLKQDVQTIILDELEILWGYLETYVCAVEGVNKVKEGNSGYGLWGDLKTEWEKTILQLLGSGFCIVLIMHSAPNDSGKMFPVGDTKRMLPILINNADVIGYVKGNGLDADGMPIHSSLILTDCDECFARTRNEYIGKLHPVIEDFTADNLINAYFNGIDAQADSEGITPITKQEQDLMFENEREDFNELMNECSELCNVIAEKLGRDAIIDVIEEVLGKDKKLSNCTEKNYEAVLMIRNNLRDLV